ncbi:serine hydrolase [Bradyrhizobium sp. 199]|uniref:serine hydrolase n=1 Tax=Bradyrhizobium sp. 199 TaxID=2782664 RepID=UPI001FF81195|nr:serine hydrolase [Bradyrhizobium sp. 199]MCK1361053.1 serine hydrolase [Bradyrhizobium sp. 199]
MGPTELRAAEAPVWPIPDWQVSTPEQEGMDSAELVKIIAYGETKSFDSLLIARHGRIVLDAYYAPYTGDIPHNLNSATKSIVSSLVAILRKDGVLDSFEHPGARPSR